MPSLSFFKRFIHFPFYLVGLFMIFSLVSCSDDDDKTDSIPLVSKSFQDLPAQQTSDYSTNPPTIKGEFTRFNLATGQITTGDDWDIAFRGTTILVNGGTASSDDQPTRTGNAGAYIASGTMGSTKNADAGLIQQDSETQLAIPTGSGNGWYNYAGPPSHLITPIAGKVIVVRTHDNHYAKVEILSYYKGAPAEPTSDNETQHYTFNYVYQPNSNTTSFD